MLVVEKDCFLKIAFNDS